MELYEEDAVREFISRLPELTVTPPTTHLLMLAVRSRKAKQIFGIKMSDVVVERKIIRPLRSIDWRERYFHKVANFATLQEGGKYEVKGHFTVPEVMAIYATLSPRDVYKSIAQVMKDSITYLYQKDESADEQLSRHHNRFASALHKFKKRDYRFVTLDLDVDDRKLLKEIRDEVSILPVFMVTETSRGYHIVLDVSKPEDAKVFYGEEALIHKLGLKYADKGLEIQKDSQEPVPGTRYFRNDGTLHYVRLLE